MTEPARSDVPDVAYPVTYFRELSPAWLAYAARSCGAPAPDVTGPFDYLELGCGAGLSTVLHAAAFPRGRFHACDVNASALALGRDRARLLCLDNVALRARSFAELDPTELPAMDFVVLHGVYSWVDDAERRTLHDLMRRLLKPGGLAYVSYNCLPGWTAEMPLRRLLAELADGEPGDAAARAGHALARLGKLGEAGLRYLEDNPAAQAALRGYPDRDPAYLAHEFLGAGWAPMYSVDLHARFAADGLDFVASATLADNHPELLLSAAQADQIAALRTARQRQLGLDFAVNRQFRRDLFAAATPPAGGTVSPLIGCTGDPARLPPTVRVPRGIVRFDAAFTGAVGELLADGTTSLDAAAAALSRHPGEVAAVRRNLEYLLAAGVLTPFARTHAVSLDALRGDFDSAVRHEAFRRIAASGTSAWVASEIAGCAVPVSAEEAAAVLDAARGRCAPGDSRLPHAVARAARLGWLR